MKRILTLTSLALALSIFVGIGESKSAIYNDGKENTGSAPDYWYTVDPEDESSKGMVQTSLGGNEAGEESNQIFSIDPARQIFTARTSEGIA
ncbi:MAG TPA: hypothetical protein ENI69_07400, partial [Rhodospirillales bacterium]|nr:hypothetical protein [Rhodospirillales bacterium]